MRGLLEGELGTTEGEEEGCYTGWMIPHISHSQYKAYTSCPRSWYLSKVRQGEEIQSWYIPIGSAVHDAIEEHVDYLHGNREVPVASMETYFYPLIEKQMRIEPDLSKWKAGGPEAAPITHDKALQRAKDCFERALQELEDIEVWEVEYDASGPLPGLSVPVKGFIDIVGEHKKKGPVVVDWKTGSTKPDKSQLETYAALLKHNDHSKMFCVDQFDFGRYVMLAPGAPNTRYVDLSDIDPAAIGAKYQAVVDKMNEKLYAANAGFGCRFCFQAENCLVNKGMTQRAVYYDRSADDGYPF